MSRPPRRQRPRGHSGQGNGHDGSENRVGYGKPPRAHQFKRGQSNECTVFTAIPAAQWPIESVSSSDSEKRKFSKDRAEIFGRNSQFQQKYGNFRDSRTAKKPRICGLFQELCRPKRRDRTCWLTWQESNSDIPTQKLPFEIWALFGANSQISGPRIGTAWSCFQYGQLAVM